MWFFRSYVYKLCASHVTSYTDRNIVHGSHISMVPLSFSCLFTIPLCAAEVVKSCRFRRTVNYVCIVLLHHQLSLFFGHIHDCQIVVRSLRRHALDPNALRDGKSRCSSSTPCISCRGSHWLRMTYWGNHRPASAVGVAERTEAHGKSCFYGDVASEMGRGDPDHQSPSPAETL